MISWYYTIIVAAFLLCFLVYKEWMRKNKARLMMRLLASAFAVGSLLMMAYPGISPVENNSLHKIIVLTDGFNQDSVQSFLKQTNENIPVFSADRSLIHANSDQQIKFVPDLTSFIQKYTSDTLHVFGNGFAKEKLHELNNHTMQFHAAPAFAAVQSVYWKKILLPGELFTIQGKYSNPLSTQVKIILRAFDETMDSVFIPAKTIANFTLNGILKNTGKAVYSLIAFSNKTVLENEPVPIEVKPASVLKMLILSSAPDFENTFLKNRLSQNGYSVNVKTIIAKEKTDNQFLNMPAAINDNLSAAYLDKFDIIMADEDVFKIISSSELAAIRTSIADKGLGLFVKLNGEKTNPTFYSQYFPIQKLDSNKKGTIAIHSFADDSSNYSLQIDAPTTIKHHPNTQILLQDKSSNVYAAVALYGQGKIIATTLNNTYSLALAGNNQAYQSLWSLLLQKAAKKLTPASVWQKLPQLSLVNDPTIVTTDNDNITMASIENNNIYLQQNQLLPYQQHGLYWPQTPGWQALVQNGKIQYEWYAFKTGDYKKLFDLEHWQATKKYTAANPVSAQLHKSNIIHWNFNAPFWFLLIFLGCVAFLWIEQKKV